MGLLAFIASSILAVNAYDCSPPDSLQPQLLKSDVQVVRNNQEAHDQYQRIYNDSRRLQNRISWSEIDQQFIFRSNNSLHFLPQSYINNLKSHLLQALEHSYAEFIYYGDMGHLHLLIPQKTTTLDFRSTDLLSLFHTGELYQFKQNGQIFGNLVEDVYWQWLYWHRKFVGTNRDQDILIPLRAPLHAAYNTVRAIKHYKEVGAVYFSANKNGCFHLKNKSVDLRFDISVVF